MKVKIRAITKKDVPQMRLMIRALSRFHGEEAKVTEGQITAACFRKGLAYSYIAYEGTKALGFVTGYDWMNFLRGKQVHHVDLLFVKESVRQKGMGRLLMQYACRKALARGCARVDVAAAKSNPVSNAFYKNTGWTPRHKYSNAYCLQDRELKAFCNKI